MLRNPKDPGWPDRGARTERREIAERWAWDYYASVQDQQHREVFGLGPKPRPIRQVAEEYLARRSATVERSTWSADRTAVGHLLDSLPSKATTAHLRPQHVEDLFSRMLAEGYRASTLTTYYCSLGVFLATIGCEGYLSGVALPKPGKVDARALDAHEMRRVRNAARDVDPKYPGARVAVEIGFSMGLRCGEIFGLKWPDINPEHRSVRVSRQIRVNSWEPSPLKGKLGRTALVLPSWWDFHTGGIGYVIGRDGGPAGTGARWTMINAVMTQAGLNRMGLGWHALRHTYARLCLEDYAVSLEELQRFLGHASITTTQQSYGHYRPSVALESAARKVYGG